MPTMMTPLPGRCSVISSSMLPSTVAAAGLRRDRTASSFSQGAKPCSEPLTLRVGSEPSHCTCGHSADATLSANRSGVPNAYNCAQHLPTLLGNTGTD